MDTRKVATLRGIATIPEFIWELSFGIYPIVKEFKPSPNLAEADVGRAEKAASS